MSRGVLAPSRDDGLVAYCAEAIGGRLGRHAQPGSSATATTVALLGATVCWLLLIWRQLPCRQLPGHAVDRYASMCYSDIPLLYRGRGLADGYPPYFAPPSVPSFEYPVLTGGFVEVLRRVAVLLGVPVGPGLTEAQVERAADVFHGVNLVVLGLLFLLVVWLQARSAARRPWDAVMVAVSPCVLLAGAINWDLFCVALTSLGFVLWARRRPGWAGALWGLGMAAKLYPLLLLGPLFVLCLRGRRLPAFGRALLGFAVAWSAANLPVLVLAPQAWLDFWVFNSERSGDFGSLWYVFALAGTPVPHLNAVDSVLLVLACGLIAALIALAPRRPRLGQVSFLVVAAFLMTNKVYSPQYVLWLLPLVVLARPRWREWVVFTAGEVVYFVAIWWHLGGAISPGDGGPDVAYWAAVLIRLATQGWVVAMVVRDCLHPELDPVRHPAGEPAVDDPGGGVLDRAPDAPWVGDVRRWAGPRESASARPGAGGLVWVTRAWLGSRLLLALTACVVALTTGRTARDLLANWDVKHFFSIASRGYLADPKTMAFFPFWPLLLRAGSAVGLDPLVTGVALALAGSLAAAIALYRLGGAWAAALWLFAPTTVFTFVPYTESLFCAAAFWAWERARRGRWGQVAALAAVACGTRVSGLFLLGALALLIVFEPHDDPRPRFVDRLPRLLCLTPGALVLAGFAVFLHGLTGSWTAWYHAQAAGWPRGFTWPWQSFLNTLPAALGAYPQWAWMFRFEIVSMVVGVVVTALCLGRRRWGEAGWVGVQVLAFSLSYWFFSVNRAVLLWFPLWLLLAGYLGGRRPRPVRGAAWLAVSAVVAVWWAWMFFTGAWAS